MGVRDEFRRRRKKRVISQMNRGRERERTRMLRASACMEACVSDLSRPSHISRSVAFAPSHFPSRPVNDPVDRCSRCSKVIYQHAQRDARALADLFRSCYRLFQERYRYRNSILEAVMIKTAPHAIFTRNHINAS